MRYYSKTAEVGKIFAKVVNGKLLLAHRVNTNTACGLDSWQEYESVEHAQSALVKELHPTVIARSSF